LSLLLNNTNRKAYKPCGLGSFMPKPMTFKEYLEYEGDSYDSDNLCFWTDVPTEHVEKIINKKFTCVGTRRKKQYKEEGGVNMSIETIDSPHVFRRMRYPTYVMICSPFGVSGPHQPTLEYVRDFIRRVIDADMNCVYLGQYGALPKVIKEKDVIAYNMKK